MEEELSSRETALQIVRDVCGISTWPKKKKKNRGKKMETDIDIFADEEHLQIRQSPRNDYNS